MRNPLENLFRRLASQVEEDEDNGGGTSNIGSGTTGIGFGSVNIKTGGGNSGSEGHGG